MIHIFTAVAAETAPSDSAHLGANIITELPHQVEADGDRIIDSAQFRRGRGLQRVMPTPRVIEHARQKVNVHGRLLVIVVKDERTAPHNDGQHDGPIAKDKADLEESVGRGQHMQIGQREQQ